MGSFIGYQYALCHETYGPDRSIYTCPHNGAILDVLPDYESIRANTSIQTIEASLEPSIWRYLLLLPVADPGHQGNPLRAVGEKPAGSPSALSIPYIRGERGQ